MANSDSSVLQETILRAMDAVVTQRNNELKLDKTITAIIKKNAGARNGRALYEVEYEGGRLVATAQNSTDSYVPNTSVYVLVPQGNFSNEKIIIGRANTITTDRSASVIAAAANSYSIIGSNLIESTSEEKIKNIQYGLHSFHDHTTEDLTVHPRDHRFQILYDIKDNSSDKIKFNDNKLHIYKEQTTALMLKADFQTNLDIAQRRQANARYGLIFNFSFDNLNKGFGETNGEIFENLAPIVEGKVYTNNINEPIQTKTLIDYHKAISDTDFSYSTSLLDEYIEEISTLYNNFLINKRKLNTDLISNLVAAYLNLLNDLKNITASDEELQKNQRKAEYIKWWEEQVGEPGQKIEQFILTSDMMLGNPLAFSQWNTQYTVFTIDMNTFNHLESIYFFKEGFIENTEAEESWPIGEEGGPDIFVKNLQIYAMKPLESQSGDYSLKVEPSGDNDFILSAANPSTKLKATVLRQLVEDLTGNDKTTYYWFKESSAIVNSSSDGYNYLAGVGWKLLPHEGIKYNFKTDIDSNPGYKNNYKCIAVYEPASDDKIILALTFSVYNEDAAIKMKLESNIGTEFSFDEGVPTISVLLHNNDMREEEYAEIGFKKDVPYIINNIEYKDGPHYKYTWAVTDSVNGQKIFLEDKVEEENFLLISSRQSLLNKIKHFTSLGYYDQDEKEVIEVDDSYYATKIKYPVFTTSTGFVIDCYLQEGRYINGVYRYFDVGSAQLEFNNQNENIAASNFRIQIVNGDQVFQYDEYGNAPTVNKLKEPLQIQPLQAKLISRSGLEVEGSNYTVEWIFPIENTLITTDEVLVENQASELIQSYFAKECNFGIQELYNPSFYNNQITCHISFNDIDLYKDTNFYFGKVGSNGTNGTDVVAKIEYAKEDDLNLLHYEPLTLYVQKGKISEDDQKSERAKFNVRDSENEFNKLKSPQILVGSDEEHSLLKLNLYQKDIPISSDSFAEGYPRWGIAGSAVTGTNNTANINNNGKFFKVENSLENGSTLQWDYDYNNEDRFLRIQNLKAETKLKTGETYYAYFSLPIIEYEAGQNLQLKLHKDTIAIDRPTYLNEIVYNADGRNPIYNHNAGLKLINLPENAIIYWEAKGGLDGEKYLYGTGVKEYYESTPDFSLAFEKDAINTYPYLISEYTLTHEADMRAAYELEREQAKSLYYTEIKDENNNILNYEGTKLYLTYKEEYEQRKANAFSNFKKQALWEIQNKVKRTWVSQSPTDGDNGKVLTLKDGSNITQAQIEEMYTKKEDFADSYWFSAHISEWWDDSQWNEEEYSIIDSEDEYNTLSDEQKTKVFYYAEPLLSPLDYFNSTFKSYDAFIQESENIQTQIITKNSAMVYILPNDSYNGAATNNRIEAKIYTLNSNNERELYATVYAPINITLNTFGLASVNAWDGNSVTIDEDRGAVLAPQVAAGEKDDNNRFTGIVMGKTETYTGEAQNEKEIGLFGYAYGLQSIFLDSETGNATFGLPDGNKLIKDNNNKYIGLGTDDYGEGRIELRPGDVSRIGGWRLGRRSLYYTSSPSSTEVLINPLTQRPYINRYLYSYSGEIGPAYEGDVGTPGNKQYATHHEKDIKTEDAGLLLSANPAYISIKGKRLGQTDIDSGLNSQLAVGDSLEIQLDPQTPTLFTIFRHNSDTRRENPGKRVYLAGINDKGELLANGVGKEDGSGTGTKSGNIVLKAFKDTIDQESGSYVGSVFEAGSGLASTRTFFQIFREKTNPLDTSAQVYMTGGQVTSSGEFVGNSTGDEYLRPISIHGNSIGLFAKTGNPSEVIGYDENGDPIAAGYNWTSTDANIQISTNEAKIELGNSVGLFLQRNYNTEKDNYLKTSGPMTVNIGDAETAVGKRSLTINSAQLIGNITQASITNTGITQIYNAGSMTISSPSNIFLNRTNSENVIISELQLQQDNVLLGIPAGTGRKSLITMSHNGVNSWDTIGTLNISSTNTGNAILIHANHLGSGVTHNGTTSPQLELRAGTGSSLARILLSSSDNSWVNTAGSGSKIGGYYKTDGEPFRVQHGSQGISIKTNIIRTTKDGKTTDTRFYNFCTDMSIRAAGGIVLTGGLNAPEKSGASDYGLWSVKGLHTEFGGNNNADKILSFASTQFKGTQSNSYSITTTNLKAAIDYCLRAATSAWQASEDLKNSLGSAAYADTSDFRSSSWNPSIDTSNFVTKGTYYLNSGGQIPTSITAGGTVSRTSATSNFYVTL